MHHPHNIIIGFRIQTLHSQVIYLFPRCVLFPCFYFEFFFLSLWEQYQLIVEKPKPKWSQRLIITKENVIVSRWELKVKQANYPIIARENARENAGVPATISSRFAPQWLRQWCEFPGPIRERANNSIENCSIILWFDYINRHLTNLNLSRLMDTLFDLRFSCLWFYQIYGSNITWFLSFSWIWIIEWKSSSLTVVLRLH